MPHHPLTAKDHCGLTQENTADKALGLKPKCPGSLMSSLLPNQAKCHEFSSGPVQHYLHPLEEEHIFFSGMSDSRRRDFTLGRWCAREALLHFACKDWPLLPAPSRAPIWPEGIVGSITHCENFCAAAVGSTKDFETIGIDAEVWKAMSLELLHHIAGEGELSASSLDPNSKKSLALIFSAKESVYKALYPLTRKFFDFMAIELKIDPFSGKFVIMKTHVKELMPYSNRIEGRFYFQDEIVLTASYIMVRPG